MTERDRRLLEFVAEHRLVQAAHAQALMGVSAAAAYGRLHHLGGAGLLAHRQVFHHQPGCYQITRLGLAAVGRRLPVPRLDLAEYRHDLGVAWIWLAARREAFGPVCSLTTERRLRSLDGSREESQRAVGVRLGVSGRGGRPSLHYPDLLVTDPAGRRIALELELTLKGRVRRERILTGYGLDDRIERVLYLTDDAMIDRKLRGSARRLGLTDRVHVRSVQFPGSREGTRVRSLAGRGLAAVAGR